jgi:hypothetical protein
MKRLDHSDLHAILDDLIEEAKEHSMLQSIRQVLLLSPNSKAISGDNIDALAQQIMEGVQAQSQVLTCVYCGHEYPPGTPPSNHQVLREHIAKCDKHPMKAVNDRLNAALKALSSIGSALPCSLVDLIGRELHEEIYGKDDEEDKR